MSRVIGIIVVFIVGLSAVLGAFLWVRATVTTYDGEVTSPSGRLVCSQEANLRYLRLAAEAGEMSLGYNINLETPSNVDRLLASFDALELTGAQTVVVAAHIASGQTYQHVCAAERCTMVEMAEPQRQCLTDHFSGCTEIAMRFRGQDHCMIAPVPVAQ